MKPLLLVIICLSVTASESFGQANNYFPQLTKIKIDGGMNPKQQK